MALLVAVIFAVYVNYLDNVVKDKFSIAENRDFLRYEQQSKVVINMLLLMEDQSFFEHIGMDVKEILRMLRDYVFDDKPLRGASTITQQLIKNELLTRERRMSRKIKEVLMAVLLERSFDKKFILNYYLNRVYLGQRNNLAIRGFQQAARFYFNHDADKLTLDEAASLVAMVKGPNYYHPIKYPKRLAERRKLVLNMYHKYKKIVK